MFARPTDMEMWRFWWSLAVNTFCVLLFARKVWRTAGLYVPLASLPPKPGDAAQLVEDGAVRDKLLTTVIP